MKKCRRLVEKCWRPVKKCRRPVEKFWRERTELNKNKNKNKNNPRNLRERTTEQLRFSRGTNNEMKKLSKWKKQNLKLGSA
jgi:hypothetical protein